MGPRGHRCWSQPGAWPGTRCGPTVPGVCSQRPTGAGAPWPWGTRPPISPALPLAPKALRASRSPWAPAGLLVPLPIPAKSLFYLPAQPRRTQPPAPQPWKHTPGLGGDACPRAAAGCGHRGATGRELAVMEKLPWHPLCAWGQHEQPGPCSFPGLIRNVSQTTNPRDARGGTVNAIKTCQSCTWGVPGLGTPLPPPPQHHRLSFAPHSVLRPPRGLSRAAGAPRVLRHSHSW